MSVNIKSLLGVVLFQTHLHPTTHVPSPSSPLVRSRSLCLVETSTRGENSATNSSDAELQAWHALFTETVLAESSGLVDRPTAVKGPDGQWQGIASTTARGRKPVSTISNLRGVSPTASGGVRGFDGWIRFVRRSGTSACMASFPGGDCTLLKQTITGGHRRSVDSLASFFGKLR